MNLFSKSRSLLAGLISAGSAFCMSGHVEAADFIDWTAQPSKVVIAGVEYAVVEVRAQFVQSGIQVVNAYDVQISSSRQSLFFQNDLSTLGGGTGTWNPSQSLELPAYGLTAANDSFVVVGGLPGGSNTTALDPDFSESSVGGLLALRGGWYNSNPGNYQGQSDASGRTWFARLVLPTSGGAATLSWVASLSFAEQLGGPPQQETASVIGYFYPADCNGNGVADSVDIASGTSLDLNSNGIPDSCEADCDANGVPDAFDPDADGDGTPDGCDNCPNDPLKTEPGLCGCGVADTDTDSDGTPDCNDNCPNIINPDQADCDSDGIGDLCEVDCNANGLPDDCDIASGFSVDSNGNGVPDECEFNVPGDFDTLQDALDAALDGWVIDLDEGTVTGTFVIEGISVTIVGGTDPSTTVLDGAGGPVFVIGGQTAHPIVIRGFTITGGGGSNGLAGGVETAVSLSDSNAVFENCIFEGNQSGAIHIVGGSPTIRDATFSHNGSDANGAALRLEDCAALISNVSFIENSAVGLGGAIYAIGGTPVIDRCLFSHNSAASAGGGVAWGGGGSMTIVETLFTGNIAPSGSAIWSDPLGSALYLDVVAHCGDLESSIAGPFVELGPVIGGENCVDCDASGVVDVLEIARGELEDINGNGAADLCEACIGDLDGDGLVYGGDLGLLLFEWGPGPSPADLNGDGIVDGGDVGILLIEWGPCGD